MIADLLGDPLPAPLPTNSRLIDEAELAGHEIRAMFIETRGTLGYPSTVIVTATGCWMVLGIGGSELDDAYIKVDTGDYHRQPSELIGYVPADELAAANCVTDAEYRRLKALEDQQKEEARQREAERLRERLAALEKQG